MNKVILIGRLTKDPELAYQANTGKAIVKFTIAVDRNTRKEDGTREADFINCVALDKRAEAIANYVAKGNLFGLAGRIQTGSYDNKEGQRVFFTNVVVDEIQFLTSKNQAASNTASQQHNRPVYEVEIIDDGDIPF